MSPKKTVILFLIILFTLLQSTILNYLRVFGAKPDLFLILTFFFSLNFGQIYGFLVGAVCGFFCELTSGVPLGFLIFVYSMVGIVFGNISRWIYTAPVRRRGFYKYTLIIEAVLAFIFNFGVYLFVFFLFQYFNINSFDDYVSQGNNLVLVAALKYIILPSSFYTAIVAPPIFRFLKMLLKGKIYSYAP